MSAAARVGIVCLMVLLVLLARLVESELARARTDLAVEAALLPPAPSPGADPAGAAGPPPVGTLVPIGSEPIAQQQPDPEGPGGEYTVKPRETLGAISKRFYGTTRFWREILAANRDRLRRARDLRAGQRIRLPADPREAGDAGDSTR